MKKLGFGTMRLPLLDPDDPKSIDLEQFEKMTDLFMERGFTYFDTAYPYHDECSEDAVRKVLVERYPRDRFLLADKMPIMRVRSADDYARFFEEQQKRCGTDYFDYYLLHNMGRDRFDATEKFGGFRFLAELKEKGLARNIGFSFHDSADTLDRILTAHPEVDFVQLQINYLDWDAAVAQSGRCYETAVRHGKKVTVMEPVKGGTLSRLPDEALKLFRDFYEGADPSPSPASLAIRYAASLPEVQTVLSGMSTMEQMEDNTSFMSGFRPLESAEKELVEKLTAILKRSVKVPCTGCRYCLEECPIGVNIPDYFGLLNLHAVTGQKTNMYHARFSMNHARASECLKCGKCEEICPQHIPIRDFLEDFAKLYEGA